MKAERVKQEEILQAIRGQNIGSLEQVEAVVIETDGSFSVLKNKTMSHYQHYQM